MTQLQELVSDVKEIKDALLGTKFNPEGFKQRLEAVECQQAEFKDYKQRIIGAVIIITTLWSLLLGATLLYTTYKSVKNAPNQQTSSK